jgi:AAA+ ATPase superfamily predicted ATPase
MPWGFYGRTVELRTTTEIIGRNRWFFAKMTGRRRISKTTLIQPALQRAGEKPILYVQTPDSVSSDSDSFVPGWEELFKLFFRGPMDGLVAHQICPWALSTIGRIPFRNVFRGPDPRQETPGALDPGR